MDDQELIARLKEIDTRFDGLEKADKLLEAQFHVASRAIMDLSQEMGATRDQLTERIDAKAAGLQTQINGLQSQINGLQSTINGLIENLPNIVADAYRTAQQE